MKPAPPVTKTFTAGERSTATLPLHPGKFVCTIPSVKKLGVMALAAFVLFFQLGTRGLSEPDEGRYAEVGREMVASGDWLVPRFNGIEHLSKPPVTYWLIAASLKAFGVNEWAARLPVAIAALVLRAFATHFPSGSLGSAGSGLERMAERQNGKAEGRKSRAPSGRIDPEAEGRRGGGASLFGFLGREVFGASAA